MSSGWAPEPHNWRDEMAALGEHGRLTRYQAWRDILHELRFLPEPRVAIIDGVTVTEHFGEVIRSHDQWAVRWHWPRTTVRGFLARLAKIGWVTIEPLEVSTKLRLNDLRRRFGEDEITRCNVRTVTRHQTATNPHSESVDSQADTPAPRHQTARLPPLNPPHSDNKRHGDTEFPLYSPGGGKGYRGLTREQKKRIRVANNSSLMERIGGWFGRKADTLWSVYCADALDELVAANLCGEEALAIVEAFHRAKAPYRRRDLEALLNNWEKEVARSMDWDREERKKGRRGGGTGVFRGYGPDVE